MKIPGMPARETAAAARCRVCDTDQDWLMLGFVANELGGPRVEYGTPLKLTTGRYREVVTLCSEGHGVSFTTMSGETLQRQLDLRPSGMGRLVAVWASQAGGKTLLVQRILRGSVTDRYRGKPLPLGVISGFGLGLDTMLRADVSHGTNQDENECRSVLLRYLEARGGMKPEEASLLLERALVAAGVSDETAELAGWGTRRQPYTPPYHFTKSAADAPAGSAAVQRWTAWLWLMDEPGEMHVGEHGDVLVKNGTAESVAWIVDASIAPAVYDQLLTDDRWRTRLVQSRREGRFGEEDTEAEGQAVDPAAEPDQARGLAQGTDAEEAAKHRTEAAKRMLINQTVLQRTSMLEGPAVGVALTKLDLVAAALEVIEDQPGSGGTTPLVRMFGRRVDDCVEAAADELVWWCTYWLQSEDRATRVSRAARAFLGKVADAGPEAYDVALKVCRGVIDEFGTAEAFWDFVTSERGVLLPAQELTGNPGGGWQVEALPVYLSAMESGARLQVRDVVTMILGRALVTAFGYGKDDLNAMSPSRKPGEPAMYFLTSVLQDYRADVDGYRMQLEDKQYLGGGLRHFYYWLLKPFMQGQ